MLDHCERDCALQCVRQTSPTGVLRVQEFTRCLLYMCGITLKMNESADLIESLDQEVLSGNSSYDSQNQTCHTTRPERLDLDDPVWYSVLLQGYVSPILVFLTVINNSLVCIVLLKPHMRSPTNAILVAMALSDMFTGLFPLPVYLYFYATKRYYEWVPYNWCFALKVFRVHLPTIFHTASIWLTMALAIQRYIYVCHSFKARLWCTIRNVIVGTIAIYAIATISQISCFFELRPVETFRKSVLEPNKTVPACILEYRPWLKQHLNLYYSTYFWARVIFIHLIPCVSLVVMNALLIYAMKKAQQRRMQLLRQNKKSESRKLKESNCTTLMLVAVVGLFLLVEFPLGLLMVFVIVDKAFGVVIIHAETVHENHRQFPNNYKRLSSQVGKIVILLE